MADSGATPSRPFVLSLSKHERLRADHSPFDRLRANGPEVQ
jgi:hypothetical protein